MPNNKRDSQKHDPEQKKPGTKGYILYDCIFMKLWNSQNQSTVIHVASCGGGDEHLPAKRNPRRLPGVG